MVLATEPTYTSFPPATQNGRSSVLGEVTLSNEGAALGRLVVVVDSVDAEVCVPVPAVNIP